MNRTETRDIKLPLFAEMSAGHWVEVKDHGEVTISLGATAKDDSVLLVMDKDENHPFYLDTGPKWTRLPTGE